MKYLIVISALSLAFSGNGLQGKTFARQTQGVVLIAKDGSLLARVFLGSDSLLVDFPFQQRGYLLGLESYVYLNRNEKTYTVHSYANIVTDLPKNPNPDIGSPQNPTSVRSAGGFTSTGETALIAGFSASRIVRIRQGRVDVEMWVSEESIPARLRSVGRKIRSMLPTDYWNDDNRTPTLVQALLAFGLPLRIVTHDGKSSEVNAMPMKAEDIPENSLEIPREYRPA